MKIENAFRFKRRGVAVVGSFEGTGHHGDAAVVRVSDKGWRVDPVYLEFPVSRDADGHRFEKVGIVLGPTNDRPPPGAIVASED